MLSKEAKTMLFVFGGMEWLAEQKLIERASWSEKGPIDMPITVKGLAAWDQLEVSGYRPTEAEVTDCVKHLRLRGWMLCDDELESAIINFLSNWDKLKEKKAEWDLQHSDSGGE